MSERILLVGDIHIRDHSPSSRVEGYREDIITKLEYVAELEKKLKADIVIWKGDVFDFPNPSRTSHYTVLRMLEVVKKFNNVWVVPGNHDTANHRIDSILEKQPLGVLIHGGLKVLDGWHPTLPVYGVPWQQDWTVNEDAPARAFKGFREGIAEGRYPSNSLAVTHAPIYPPEQQKSVVFELLPTHGEKSVSKAMGNQGSLSYGHIHEDHGIFEDEGVTYENVGALSRGSLAEYNLERQIKVAVWDSEKGFREIPVPHRPASEIFFKERHDEDKSAKKSLDSFLKDVSGTRIEISSIENVKDEIARMEEVEEPVRNKAIHILSEIG